MVQASFVERCARYLPEIILDGEIRARIDEIMQEDVADFRDLRPVRDDEAVDGFYMIDIDQRMRRPALPASGENVMHERIERPGAALLVPLWKTDKIPFGTQDATKWESFTQWLQASGLLASHVKAGEAFTNRFHRGN